jgi:hypothetical protein
MEGMSKLSEIDRGLENKAAYNAPASGELTEDQVQRFVRVQQQMRSQLGQPFTELLSSLREITGIYVDARRYQVEALNKEGFSQSEYSWVRDRMFQAAGMEIGSRIDIEKLQEAIRNGTGLEGIRADDLPRLNVPAKNRELVKPYVGQMDEWLPLVFFGL